MNFLHDDDGSASVFCLIVSEMFDEDAWKETWQLSGDILLLEAAVENVLNNAKDLLTI